MAFTMAKGGAWDFLNPANWVINKSLEQNLREFSVGTQIIGTVVPSAVAYRLSAAEIAPRVATQAAASQAAQAATATAGASAGGAGMAAGAVGLTAASLVPLATLGIKTGATIYGLDWLQKNWWIPALFVGGFIALKYLDKKR